MGIKATKNEELTDNQLMQMFALDDDQIVFERLYHKYKIPLLRFSFGYTNNTARAEEVVHETFLKVYRFKKQYNPNKAFRIWLWTVCKNTNLDTLSSAEAKLYKMTESNLDETTLEFESLEDSALEVLIKEASKEKIQLALQNIPINQREALLLWMNDDLSFIEMGSILKKSPQSVKNLIQRAKIILKNHIEESL